jgi:tetratricopeptide (TPR) repeat protein
LYFTTGYGTYRNPFVVEQKTPVPPYLDYSKPLENIPDDELPSTSTAVSEQPGEPAAEDGKETIEEIRDYRLRSPEVKEGLKSFEAATDAFQAGKFDQALKLIDAALEQLPYDSALHEFRGLVLFAREDYQGAAATIYSVLSVSPGWNWTTLSGLYGDTGEFSRQLKKLEAYHRKNPKSAAAAFLKAYHYTTCHHNEAAVKLFESVVKSFPEDRFLPQLLALVSAGIEEATPASGSATKPVSDASPAGSEAASEAETDPNSAEKAFKITNGDWRSLRGDSTIIQLRLSKGYEFVWTATTSGNPPRVFAGLFGVEKNTLYLGGGSGKLVGRIVDRPGGGFTITLLGNRRSEPGLEFVPVSSP